MKKSLLLAALSVAFVGSVFAQTPAPVTAAPGTAATTAHTAMAPAATSATAAADVSGVCKDGSAFNAATTKGACKGHGGIDKKAAAAGTTAATPTSASGAPTTAVTDKAAGKPDLSQVAVAPGGGAGKVWANDTSKVYHCQSDKFYGKTKHGEYLTEADAKAKGFHADHAKACS